MMLAQAERQRLDAKVKALVERAWASLQQSYIKIGDEYHWLDFEQEGGILKDVDALNTLIEPFLLARVDFVDPPIGTQQLLERARRVFDTREKLKLEDSGGKSTGQNRGFSSQPYTYFEIPGDFVDSASSFVRLVCNLIDLEKAMRDGQPEWSQIDSLESAMQSVITDATDFLIEACIQDKIGCRWGPVHAKQEIGVPFANLVSTNYAALALHRALANEKSKEWMGDARARKVEGQLAAVPKWIGQQFDSAIKSFWIDQAKSINQPVGTLYALETIYTLQGAPELQLRESCRIALSTLLTSVRDFDSAMVLQSDWFYKMPNPMGRGTMYYDDRRYIGALLSVLALIKNTDMGMMDSNCTNAGDIIFHGVADEWVDSPSNMWDDGRPLICYTYDALVGLICYSMGGAVQTMVFKETDLRGAITSALSSKLGAQFADLLIQELRTKTEKLPREGVPE